MIPLLSRQIQLAIKLFQGTFLEKSLQLQEAQKLSGSISETVTPRIDGFLQLAPAINGSVTPTSIPEV
jgi:hypothetical protein